MEFFIDQVRLILPALGLDFLKAPSENNTQLSVNETKQPVFIISSKKHGLRAEMQEMDGEFFVKAGSLAQGEWISTSEVSGYAKLHADLKAQGKLTPSQNGLCTFAADVAFKSPSAASAIIFGRASNGRDAWKIEATGETLGQWQNGQLNGENEE